MVLYFSPLEIGFFGYKVLGFLKANSRCFKDFVGRFLVHLSPRLANCLVYEHERHRVIRTANLRCFSLVLISLAIFCPPVFVVVCKRYVTCAPFLFPFQVYQPVRRFVLFEHRPWVRNFFDNCLKSEISEHEIL